MTFTITIPPLRVWKWLAPMLAVVAALALTWGGGVTAQQGALGDGPGEGNAGPSVDFNMFVPTLSGDDCTTLVDDKKCLVAPGDQFTVIVSLDKSLGFTFDEYVIALTYSGGLTRINTSDECAPGPFPGSTLDIDDANAGDQSVYLLDCVGSPVSSTGPLAFIEFACPPFKSKETITMVYGTESGYTSGFVAETQLISGGTSFATETSPGGRVISETIIINCNNYYPWDVHGPGQSADLDGIVDLPNDILGVIQHFCPLPTDPCAKADGGVD